MNWLIGKIIGNPLVLAIVLAAASISGACVAWMSQGLRITAAKQEFTQYKQDQAALTIKAIEQATKQRNEAEKAYTQAQKGLQDEIAKGDIYRRCVAAGRCGVRVESTCSAGSIQAASQPNATSADAVSLAGGTEALANECAVTTLLLNSLQGDIEAQDGYK